MSNVTEWGGRCIKLVSNLTGINAGEGSWGGINVTFPTVLVLKVG